jgi:hypothetical protein
MLRGLREPQRPYSYLSGGTLTPGVTSCYIYSWQGVLCSLTDGVTPGRLAVNCSYGMPERPDDVLLHLQRIHGLAYSIPNSPRRSHLQQFPATSHTTLDSNVPKIEPNVTVLGDSVPRHVTFLSYAWDCQFDETVVGH